MSPLAVIFVTVFIDLLGFGIIIPLLPYYAESFGASAFAVGMLGTSYSLMQFLFAPVWGRWSDRIGRRPIILVGLLGSGVSYLLLAYADSIALVFAARVLGGIAGANVPTAQAYIADVTTPENRAKGMGMIGAAFGLGFIFGPALGGVLSRWGAATPMYFAAALSLANFIAAWFLLPESRTGHAERPSAGRMALVRHALGRPELALLLSLFFIVTSAFSGFEATFALYAERRFGFTAQSIGYVFAFIGVVLSVVQGMLVGRAVKRFGERRVVPFAVAAIGIGLALVPVAGSVPVLLAVLGLLSAGMGFNGPSLTAMISKLADADEQGGMLGLAQSLSALGRIVGPAWGGFLFDRFGIGVPYLSAGVIMVVAFAVAMAGLSRSRAGAPSTVRA
jgi:DHA1 family tetracycline resistance protein-like MFS transporter